jgi:hypothetical protein
MWSLYIVKKKKKFAPDPLLKQAECCWSEDPREDPCIHDCCTNKDPREDPSTSSLICFDGSLFWW